MTAFKKIHRQHTVTVARPVHSYRLDAAAPPVAQSFRLTGPAAGFRLGRHGSHDFSCFSNLARTIVTPDMTDLEKAVAVYRFSNRFLHHGQIGFGGTEMTRFINCYGYSFCWGQGCFQHLLYEAAGLLARSPILTGHSSVEVFINGKWRSLDAYMRLLIPSIDLEGIATGAELRANPERFDQTREGPVIGPAKSYWAGHAPGEGTYEPWQDSRAMSLSLRRQESLQIGPETKGKWCISPSEPPHYLNGQWRWTPTFDETFLKCECDAAENVAPRGGQLAPIDPSKTARVDLVIQSPYPLAAGTAQFEWTKDANVTLAISTDQRKTWTELAAGKHSTASASLDSFLSLRGRPPDDNIRAHERFSFILRITWTGDASLKRANIECDFQLHSPAWPQAEQGVNLFSSIGAETGASIEHEWDEYPEFTASNLAPFEGETVTLSTLVHNPGSVAMTQVPVVFSLRNSGEILGKCIIDRIEPNESARASLQWTATSSQGKSRFGRPYNDEITSLYVETSIVARIENSANPDDAARLAIRVRPRPQPKFNEHLIWTGPTQVHGGRADATPDQSAEIVIRAGVIHQSDPLHQHAYLSDTPLDVEVTLYAGPPENKLPLAAPRRLIGIQPSEFGVAEWRVPTNVLPDTLDLHVVVTSGCPVAPEHRRIVARRAVTIRA